MATPIAVNRDTPRKGRDLSSRAATKIRFFGARGLIYHNEHDDDPPKPGTIHTVLYSGSVTLEAGVLTHFNFTTMISEADMGEMRTKAIQLMLQAFPGLNGGIRRSYKQSTEPAVSGETIKFTFKVSWSERRLEKKYDGYMKHPFHVPAEKPWPGIWAGKDTAKLGGRLYNLQKDMIFPTRNAEKMRVGTFEEAGLADELRAALAGAS
ncbi:hypothetical protein BDP27DRAFT_730610 [Rhodocollybia butyracea]|uniref:Uncharacterized protein n=1 Tax=Rhodocollybia butyracea TaxID=206335 RepID=A0A9P5PVL3_9AGAR|nr:hypothetical protein BDP27DRAFT_730610 [Rhodocollybia butyracea]